MKTMINRALTGVFVVFILTGCSRKPSGIYEQDFSSLAPEQSDTPNAHAGFRMFVEQARKTHRIKFDGDHLDVLMGEQFHLSGTFTVSGPELIVTPERVEAHPFGAATTNSAVQNLPLLEKKSTYEMYMPNNETIMFMGAVFRRSKQ